MPSIHGSLVRTVQARDHLVSIVLPTRNERDNVVLLAERLRRELEPGWEWELVVVDDSSDETPERVRELAALGYPVVLRHRPEEERRGGLGGAVLEGFALARGNVLVVMDADLQHPPERVPLLAAVVAHEGIDIAIASRFAAGGTTTGLDNVGRVVCSHALRWLTRVSVRPARSIRDPLSGFFAIDRRVLDTGPTKSEGFKVLLDVLTYGRWQDAVEVPFEFGQRASGTSKASSAEVLALVRQIVRYLVTHNARHVPFPGADNLGDRRGVLEQVGL